MERALFGGVFLMAGLVACSNEVPISPDTSGHGGGTMLLTGAGAAHPDLDELGGSAGASPVSGKVVTADTDMAQYQSTTVELSSSQPILQGPFFVTDVLADHQVTLFTVTGGDCAAAQTRVLLAPQGTSQFHGMRLPILGGQSLCHGTTAPGTLTVMGFRPY
jgi:hypothetical protein